MVCCLFVGGGVFRVRFWLVCSGVVFVCVCVWLCGCVGVGVGVCVCVCECVCVCVGERERESERERVSGTRLAIPTQRICIDHMVYLC